MTNDSWFRTLLASNKNDNGNNDDHSLTGQLAGWWQTARHHGYSEVLAAGIAVSSAALIYAIYRSKFRHYSTVSAIPARLLKGRGRIMGRCTAVNDGDTFRFYHTILGPLTRIPRTRKELQHKTLSIRLAGIDAPEAAHFGMPAQPLANEARTWLDRQLQGRAVLLVPYSVDRYGRLVASVWTRPFGLRWMPFGLPLLNWLRQDVSLRMLRSGMASLYTGHDVEFGGRKAQYIAAERQAQFARLGIWALSKKKRVLPGEHKRIHLRGGH